jgi:glutamate-1-semialdehyde 2,1-aminomutase
MPGVAATGFRPMWLVTIYRRHYMFLHAAMTEADIDFAIAAATHAFAALVSRLTDLKPHPAVLLLMASHAA